jgi:hypothetical protein
VYYFVNFVKIIIMPLPLIFAAAGAASSLFGAAKGIQAGNQMKRLAEQVPTRERSQYVGQQLGTAQMEVNANPFLSAQNRATLGRQANMMAGAQKNVTDPSQLLALTSAYGAQASEDAFRNDQANQQMRMQKLQDLYNAQRLGYAEDQAMYNDKMTAFNSRANLMSAGNQSITGGLQNLGGTLISAGRLNFKK